MTNEIFDLTLGIKIKETKGDAKLLMYLKKQTGKSLSEIKNILEAQSYVFQCENSDDDGLHLINQMKHKINELGYNVALFECGREVPSYMLDNLEKMHKKIDEECEQYPD